MDNITKYKIDKIIEIYGKCEIVVDNFKEAFSEATLNNNPDVAVEILNYLNSSFTDALDIMKEDMEAYKPAENYPKQVKNLCSFSNNFKINKIRNIAEIYKYIWNCISANVDDDGSIRTPFEVHDEDI